MSTLKTAQSPLKRLRLDFGIWGGDRVSRFGFGGGADGDIDAGAGTVGFEVD